MPAKCFPRNRLTELRSGKRRTLRYAIPKRSVDRLGALPIEMLGGNEFRLREVGGVAANFNRANRRGVRLRRLRRTLRAVQGRDVGAKRRGLMRPVDGWMRYGFEGALYTPPGKMIGIYSPPLAANSARLLKLAAKPPTSTARTGAEPPLAANSARLWAKRSALCALLFVSEV